MEEISVKQVRLSGRKSISTASRPLERAIGFVRSSARYPMQVGQRVLYVRDCDPLSSNRFRYLDSSFGLTFSDDLNTICMQKRVRFPGVVTRWMSSLIRQMVSITRVEDHSSGSLDHPCHPLQKRKLRDRTPIPVGGTRNQRG